MTGYRLTQDAQSDLIEIRSYTLRQWGAAQSQKYLSELRKTIRLFAETPSLGRVRSEVALNVLSFPYVSHVIYYVEYERQLVVFALLHKRMVPLTHVVERERI
jgi:toxin ParE1/3/4